MITQEFVRSVVLRDGTRRSYIVFGHDLTMAGVSFVLAFYLRVGGDVFVSSSGVVLTGLPIFIVVAGVVFQVAGMCRGMWRYASLPELAVVVKSTALTVLLFLPLMFMVDRLAEVPRSVPVIQCFVLVVLLGGPRLAYRLLRGEQWYWGRLKRFTRRQIPVLLIGACDDGALFMRAMSGDPEAPFRVVGILDDEPDRLGRSMQSVPVLGRIEQLADAISLLRERGVRPQRIIIAGPPGRFGGDALRCLFTQAEDLGLAVARLPSLIEFKEGVTDSTTVGPRRIVLEDLLSRPQAAFDPSVTDRLIASRRILITGAGGTIGSELVRQIAALQPAELVLLDSSEFNLYSVDLELRERHPGLRCRSVLCDIRNRVDLTRIFGEYRPELVFHAAALKHVPMVELNSGEGVLTNVIGTRNVADAADRYGTLAMVLISTDKAVNPTGIMGATKRLAEFYCQSLDLARDGGSGMAGEPSPRFMTVRFGNVLGSSGSVVPLFQRQLAAGGPLTVTHPEVERYFMTVRESVELILRASAHGLNCPPARGQIFVLDMGEPVKVLDIARRIIRLAGLRPDVDMKIELSGLRPGEKLREELFDDREQRLSSEIEGVLVATSHPVDLEILRRSLDELAAAGEQHDDDLIRRLIGHLIPSFEQRHPDSASARVRSSSAAGRAYGPA